MQNERLRGLWYRIARGTCRLFCVLVFRFRVYGRQNIPRTGGFLLAGNHQSFLDPVFEASPLKRPMNFLARETLFHHPFFGRLIRSLNSIPVGRDRADITAMREVIKRLKAGEGVCLYPESTRTADGKIAPFKRGFGLLCRRSRVPVVPVLVDGAFECWPRHKKMFSPGPVEVWYGEVIRPEQYEGMEDEELADLVVERLRRMQTECRIRQGKKPYDYSR